MELDFDGYALGGFSVGEPKGLHVGDGRVIVIRQPARRKAPIPYGPGISGRYRRRALHWGLTCLTV